MEVLLKSSNGIWVPQSRMYFSQSSKILVSRHPSEVVEEILYTYCPQCYSKFSADDAFENGNVCRSCKLCPSCSGVVVVTTPDTSLCSSCGWTGIEGEKPVPDQAKVFFDQLLSQYSSLSKKKSDKFRKADRIDSRMQIADLERKLAESGTRTHEKDYLSDRNMNADLSRESYRAEGVRLRSKRTVRCRRDIEDGKLNILVQPKPYPLDGDSSMKLQMGDWWVKDSSIIHTLPLITVRSVPTLAQIHANGWGILSLRLRNPKDAPASIRFVRVPHHSSEREYVRINELGDAVHCVASVVATTSPRLNQSAPDDEYLTIDIEAYEDELLRGDSDGSKKEFDSDAMSAMLAENVDFTSRPWTFLVDGHNCQLNIPVHLDISSCNPNSKGYEVNVNYLWSVEEIELMIENKFVVSLS